MNKNMDRKTELVNELLSQMTVREKIGQIAQIAAGYRCYTLTDDGGIAFTDEFKKIVADYGGIGAISGLLRADPWSGHYYGNGITREMRIDAVNKLQTYLEENTRLKIPALIEVEASHGLQALGSVMYPTGLCSAASFNPGLYGEMMECIGDEIALSGNHVAFVTLIDLARDPRWGRSEECLGEDGYLASTMAYAAVNGLKKSGTLACAKHFAGAGVCEGGINCGMIHLGKRELDEIHMAPAKAAIRAGCDLFMVVYNSIDGQPVHSDKKLLTDYLRGKLGFDGVVISDGGGVGSVKGFLGISKKDAAILCLKAGVDLSLADGFCYTELETALADGEISEEEIDRACRRVLNKKFEAGLFEEKELDKEALNRFCADRHCEKIAYDMAAESVTLLKNNNILPLSKDQRIAVIGENADDIYHILGDYTSERLPEEGTTLLGGLRTNFAHISYEKGWSFNGDNNFEAAIRLAKDSDVIVLTLGGTSRRDFEAKYLDNGAVSRSKNFMDCGEGLDIAELSLPKQQLELLCELRKLGKPIVSVVIMGRAYVLTDVKENSDALLVGYYPGQEGGYAISDILSGKVNPSGKLPITLPRSAGVLPLTYDRYFARSSASPKYYDCGETVLYPFGFGLSYSSFDYSSLSVTQDDESMHIRFDVANTSDIDGKEVCQVYLQLFGDSVVHRRRKLFAFKKIYIPAKTTVTAEFSITYADLGFVSPISPAVNVIIGDSGHDYLSARVSFNKNQD